MKQNKHHRKPKSAMGGLVGRSSGGRIENSHFEGKITINGNREDVDVGGLVGQSENTEIVGSSADAKVEFTDRTHSSESILELKPNFHGIGINLRALAKRIRRWFKH